MANVIEVKSVLANAGSTSLLHVVTALSFVAILLNAYGFMKGDPAEKVLNSIRGALATFYFGSYIWLNFHPNSSGDWLDFMIGFGIITWCSVWCYAPVLSVIRYRKAIRRARREDA